MRSHFKVIFALLFVPLLAYGVTSMSWRGALTNESDLQKLGLQRSAALTVGEIVTKCESVQTRETEFVCNSATLVQRVSQGAIYTMTLGLLTYGAINGLGFLAQRRPAYLIRSYRLGLHLALLVALILLPVQILLIIGAFWIFIIPVRFAAAFAVYGLLPLALALVVVLTVGTYYILRAYLHLFRPPASKLAAYALTPMEAPLLWQEVATLAASMATTKPQHILVGHVPGFSASAYPIYSVRGKLQGMTLILPLTQLSICSLPDFRAIVAHELAHFRAQDVELTRRFFPLWRSTVILLDSMQTKVDLNNEYDTQFAAVRYGLLAPLRLMLSNLLHLFWRVERTQRRQRELAADAASAQMIGAMQMASALVKLHAYAKTQDNTNRAIIYGVTHDQPLSQIAGWFRSSAGYRTELIKPEELDDYAIPHPLDTHPLLRERLQALDVSLSDIVDQATKLPMDDTAASGLIPNFQTLDAAITMVVNATFQLPFKKAIKEFNLSSWS